MDKNEKIAAIEQAAGGTNYMISVTTDMDAARNAAAEIIKEFHEASFVTTELTDDSGAAFAVVMHFTGESGNYTLAFAPDIINDGWSYHPNRKSDANFDNAKQYIQRCLEDKKWKMPKELKPLLPEAKFDKKKAKAEKQRKTKLDKQLALDEETYSGVLYELPADFSEGDKDAELAESAKILSVMNILATKTQPYCVATFTGVSLSSDANESNLRTVKLCFGRRFGGFWNDIYPSDPAYAPNIFWCLVDIDNTERQFFIPNFELKDGRRCQIDDSATHAFRILRFAGFKYFTKIELVFDSYDAVDTPKIRIPCASDFPCIPRNVKYRASDTPATVSTTTPAPAPTEETPAITAAVETPIKTTVETPAPVEESPAPVETPAPNAAVSNIFIAPELPPTNQLQLQLEKTGDWDAITKILDATPNKKAAAFWLKFCNWGFIGNAHKQISSSSAGKCRRVDGRISLDLNSDRNNRYIVLFHEGAHAIDARTESSWRISEYPPKDCKRLVDCIEIDGSALRNSYAAAGVENVRHALWKDYALPEYHVALFSTKNSTTPPYTTTVGYELPWLAIRSCSPRAKNKTHEFFAELMAYAIAAPEYYANIKWALPKTSECFERLLDAFNPDGANLPMLDATAPAVIGTPVEETPAPAINLQAANDDATTVEETADAPVEEKNGAAQNGADIPPISNDSTPVPVNPAFDEEKISAAIEKLTAAYADEKTQHRAHVFQRDIAVAIGLKSGTNATIVKQTLGLAKKCTLEEAIAAIRNFTGTNAPAPAPAPATPPAIENERTEPPMKDNTTTTITADATTTTEAPATVDTTEAEEKINGAISNLELYFKIIVDDFGFFITRIANVASYLYIARELGRLADTIPATTFTQKTINELQQKIDNEISSVPSRDGEALGQIMNMDLYHGRFNAAKDELRALVNDNPEAAAKIDADTLNAALNATLPPSPTVPADLFDTTDAVSSIDAAPEKPHSDATAENTQIDADSIQNHAAVDFGDDCYYDNDEFDDDAAPFDAAPFAENDDEDELPDEFWVDDATITNIKLDISAAEKITRTLSGATDSIKSIDESAREIFRYYNLVLGYVHELNGVDARFAAVLAAGTSAGFVTPKLILLNIIASDCKATLANLKFARKNVSSEVNRALGDATIAGFIAGQAKEILDARPNALAYCRDAIASFDAAFDAAVNRISTVIDFVNAVKLPEPPNDDTPPAPPAPPTPTKPSKDDIDAEYEKLANDYSAGKAYDTHLRGVYAATTGLEKATNSIAGYISNRINKAYARLDDAPHTPEFKQTISQILSSLNRALRDFDDYFSRIVDAASKLHAQINKPEIVNSTHPRTIAWRRFATELFDEVNRIANGDVIILNNWKAVFKGKIDALTAALNPEPAKPTTPATPTDDTPAPANPTTVITTTAALVTKRAIRSSEAARQAAEKFHAKFNKQGVAARADAGIALENWRKVISENGSLPADVKAFDDAVERFNKRAAKKGERQHDKFATGGNAHCL